MIEELRAGAADVNRLLELLARLAVLFAVYAFGRRALAVWARSAAEGGERVAERAVTNAWAALTVAALAGLIAYSLNLRRLRLLYDWGAALSGWSGERVVPIVATVLAALVALKLVGFATARLTPSGAFSRRRVRLETLRGVVGSSLRILIVSTAAVTILGDLGVNVAALVAGVSILGLAVSFGAQNLVRDVITGFFILLEDQYGVGDIVRVNTLEGTVESLGLRTTVLRDLEGTAIIVPNGQITTVQVLSRDWARAVVDVELPAGLRIDDGIAVIDRTAKEFEADPAWQDRFLEPAEVAGVQSVAGGTASVRVLMKVQPKQQWAVGREFRRRVKNALDAAVAAKTAG